MRNKAAEQPPSQRTRHIERLQIAILIASVAQVHDTRIPGLDLLVLVGDEMTRPLAWREKKACVRISSTFLEIGVVVKLSVHTCLIMSPPVAVELRGSGIEGELACLRITHVILSPVTRHLPQTLLVPPEETGHRTLTLTKRSLADFT